MEDEIKVLPGGNYEDLKHELTDEQMLNRATALSVALRFAQIEFDGREEPEAKDVLNILTLEKEQFVDELSPEGQHAVDERVREWEASRGLSRKEAARAASSLLHNRVSEIVQVQRESKGE